jgi:hypothetical protein
LIRRQTTQQVNSPIRRHAIYHQMLAIVIVLKPNALQRFSNKGRLVEGRCNDGDSWRVFHEGCLAKLCVFAKSRGLKLTN